jgi:hypothetical protein
MEFLSSWVKDFNDKVGPILSKLALDTQQPSTREPPSVGLGRSMDDDGGFGDFFSS